MNTRSLKTRTLDLHMHTHTRLLALTLTHAQSHAPLHPAAAPPALALSLSRQNIYST